MKTTMYIPKVLHIGYQERADTYSGKLAYVVYTDDKGKLRKEGSWRSWSKAFLPDSENVPTEGFVLNRDVGGVRQSYGWDARLEKVRVYDPRGFEVEITIPNLLFILQECTSTKGKGLEGKFVYAWDGTNMVLLPTTAEQYLACTEFSANQAKKVSKEDVKLGHWVKFKDDQDYIYLGRHKARSGTWEEGKNYHIYYNPNESEYTQYRYETGFTKIAIVSEQDENYAQYLEDFLKSWRMNPIVNIEWVDSKVPNSHGYYRTGFILLDGKVYKAYYRGSDQHYSYYYYNNYCRLDQLKFRQNTTEYTTFSQYLNNRNDSADIVIYEQDLNVQWVKPVFILSNGEKTEEGK